MILISNLIIIRLFGFQVEVGLEAPMVWELRLSHPLDFLVTEEEVCYSGTWFTSSIGLDYLPTS